MGFLIFLLIIILIFMWPLIKVSWHVNRVRRAYRDMASAQREAYRQYRDAHGRGPGAGGQGSGRRKIYSRDEGEYVEYTEIDDTEVSQQSSYTSSHTTVTEEQVSDAKWEEIK